MSENHKTACSTRIDIALLRSLDDRICPPQPGDGDLLARVKLRVMGAVKQDSQALHRTVRSEAGVWEQIAP
ncbi:MAG: hypothetical protein LH617_15060, partial [Ramlibacter sp.]|nr:hypothetical protein [Ramlibacter sp.]